MKLRRLLGIGAGIIFKGGGWAADGYSSTKSTASTDNKDQSVKDATKIDKRIDDTKK